MFVLLSVFLSSIVSNAESNTSMISEYYGFNPVSMGFHNFWNTIDFENSSLYDSEKTPIINGSPVPIVNGVADTTLWSELSLYLDGDSSNGELKLPNSFSVGNDTYSLSDFPYFLIYYNSSNWKYEVILFDNIDNLYNSFTASSCQLVDLGNRKVVQVECDSDGSCTVISYRTPNHWAHDLEVYDIGSYACSNFPICSIDSSKLNDNWLKEQVEAGYIAYWYCLCGLPYGDTNEVGNYETDYGNYSELLISNINYLITDGSNGGYSNPITNESYGSSSGSSTSQIQEHMTLDDSSTLFYTENNTFNNGNLYVYAGTDEYQMSSENIANYYYQIVGTATVTIKHNHGATSNIKYGKKSIFDYFPCADGSQQTYNFSFDEKYSFAEKGNTFSIPLSEINSQFVASSIDQHLDVLASALDSTYSGMSWWKQVNNTISGQAFAGFQFLNYYASDYDCEPVAYTYHFDLYIYNSSSDSTSSVQSKCDSNLISGVSSSQNLGTSTSEDKMTALGTDYIPSNYTTTQTNTSGNSSSNSSSSPSVSPSISGGDNSVNVNIENNPTFNNDVSSNSESSSSLWKGGILATIISLIASNKSASTSAFETISNTTGWSSILTSTYTFVPNYFWVLIFTTATTVFGIMIVAFIVKLVYRIFT